MRGRVTESQARSPRHCKPTTAAPPPRRAQRPSPPLLGFQCNPANVLPQAASHSCTSIVLQGRLRRPQGQAAGARGAWE